MPFVDGLDRQLYDLRLRWSPPVHGDRVVIVDIDEKSLADIGHWPWGRDRLAALTDELFERQHAAVVGFDMVIPTSIAGIATGVTLAIARVIGETAPLLLTALQNSRTVLNPFSEPISALPTYIFQNVAQPYPDAVIRAWGAALTLMVLVAVLFTLTRMLSARRPGR